MSSPCNFVIAATCALLVLAESQCSAFGSSSTIAPFSIARGRGSGESPATRLSWKTSRRRRRPSDNLALKKRSDVLCGGIPLLQMTDSAASPGGTEETLQNIRPLRPPTPGTNIDTDRMVNPNVDAQNLPTPSSQAQRTAKAELRRSYVSSIKSKNLAGMVSNDGNSDAICIGLGDEPNLVAVTGETGSGKSVLIAKVASLVSGGPASPTMVPSSASEAIVEMTIQLAEPHLSMVESACRAVSVDASELVARDSDGFSAKLVLQRTLSLQSGSAGKPRLKSACQVNGKAVTLKAMKAIAGPLLTIVDAAAAASALSRPNSRLSVIDTAVPTSIKAEALRTKTSYRKARRRREALEQELNSQVLPPSYSHSDDPNEEAIEMLRHWVDELDAFEGRMVKFQDSAVGGGSSGSDDRAAGSTQLSETLQRFRSASWFDYSNEKQSNGDASSTAVSEFYTQLLDFREVVKDMDEQLQAAVSARDALSAISLPDSAVTALERARNYLFDATGGQVGSTEDSVDQDIYSAAAEDAHERLNTVEMALSDCAKSLEDSNKGLLTTLERMVDSVGVSLEDIDAIIADWNTLSRKHAISPFSLPSCHKALRSELDGSVEARLMLPKAKASEEAALKEYEEACAELTAARQENCIQLSKGVTDRLPSLGILSRFEVRLNASVQRCTDPGAFGEGSGLGIDTVDFLLQHQTSSNDEGELTNGRDTARGGKLENIGSAGEKARILLAIETELPGSVGALCRSGVLTLVDGYGDEGDDTEVQGETKSVAVIYDEIDSHVGGRAAVAMAKLLVDQTRQLSNGRISGSGGQVICITHSPSVAAVADRHVVIQKAKDSGVDNADKFLIGTNPVLAALVEGNLREEELGRMCGGDLAREEALQFAAALLRDGELQKSPQ